MSRELRSSDFAILLLIYFLLCSRRLIVEVEVEIAVVMEEV
jgi:hypothetical protein